ncbi:LacI family DNA-binding transcriptional regulator [Curtobacterium sp. VKM Ac-2922]|uniref:LacI family DNA-binding transcriptional regulator n=1 Tax=Curtobacterium sp. VKM Ac-2922 TaxID=2929475 RepID=UPI001FB4540A|nr:LacI family DNA-binding transcriptional regulator [Curtobacterium sp. VKM Ac-2922]MCJ1715572.1 LacI family transcriptional regulator [Curtobacterium sp. VKM Ac-2922]
MPTADRPRKPTRRDVARLAGVSDAVVSYTLNGGAPVAADTRRRVLAAVAELGYRPNQAARALRSGSARTLVLAVPDAQDPVFSNPFFAEFAAAIESVARARGYVLSTTATTFAPDGLRTRFEEFAARMVDGVLVLSSGVADRTAIDPVGLPWVDLNVTGGRPGVASVGADLRGGAEQATEHLLGHGRTRVAFVGQLDTREPRHAGWRATCGRWGVPPGRVYDGGYTREGGYVAGLQIADEPDPPDAVFAASDRTAVGLLRAFHERGVRVPEDVAVVAFDGSWEAEYTWPPLSTLRQPVESMAEAAVRGLLDGSPPTHHEFPAELIIRASCGTHGPDTGAH